MISARHYLIDLQQLQQINEETNQARFIKRIVAPDTTEPPPLPIEYNEYSYFKKYKSASFSFSRNSNDELTNSNRQVTTTTTTTTNGSSDARTEMMKDNIELYSSFIQSLFTVLYEVYNSSAGPAVKHRCLQAVLRMIYYSPSDLLEIILKQQSISSHIASMLASSDYKIVVSALQMAEILMKKLPQVFSVYFYREGVVHQIEILIGFGISSSSLTLTSESRSQLDLTHLNENSLSQIESLDEQLPKTTTTRRYYTTSESHPATTRIETRSQRARLPKTSARSMFEEFSSRPIAARGTGASFSAETLDIGLGRGRPTRGTINPSALFRPTSSFDPSTYYPRPPVYVPSPYAYASSAPAAASLISQVTPQQQSQIILSSQEKAKLKEWIQNQAKNFRTNYFSNNTSTSNIALQIINRLASAVDILHVGKDQIENGKALRDIANIIAKGDVSPFEMVHSGLITKLYQYLTDDISIPNNRPERLKQFLNIFINIPLENEEDNEINLKQYIIELHNSQLNQGKIQHHILNHLINKLHGCINQLEQFPIRGERNNFLNVNNLYLFLVNDIAGRPAHSSALRLITTHQLKCNLIRHPQCKTLKQWNSGPVKIDPLALVSAIEKYLLLRGIASNTIVS
jgi:E3 ubiquitin-protein ligase TRIP12